MNITVVLGKNLLDLSKISDVAQLLPDHIVTGNSVNKVLNMMKAGPGDRTFTVIIDYYLYETSTIDEFLNEINNSADEHKIKPVQYKSFVPHEKVKELESAHPEVTFIPRSFFFHDIAKYIAN